MNPAWPHPAKYWGVQESFSSAAGAPLRTQFTLPLDITLNGPLTPTDTQGNLQLDCTLPLAIAGHEEDVGLVPPFTSVAADRVGSAWVNVLLEGLVKYSVHKGLICDNLQVVGGSGARIGVTLFVGGGGCSRGEVHDAGRATLPRAARFPNLGPRSPSNPSPLRPLCSSSSSSSGRT